MHRAKAAHISSYTTKGHQYHYLVPNKTQRALGLKKIRLVSDDIKTEAAHLIEQLSQYLQNDPEPFRKHLAEIFRKARDRAAKRDINFNLTLEDVYVKLSECEMRCSVSGVPLTLSGKTTGYRSPFRPSIDRINAQLGYTPENIRIVCVAVNAALSDWGDDVFWTVVNYASARQSWRTKKEQLSAGVGRTSAQPSPSEQIRHML